MKKLISVILTFCLIAGLCIPLTVQAASGLDALQVDDITLYNQQGSPIYFVNEYTKAFDLEINFSGMTPPSNTTVTIEKCDFYTGVSESSQTVSVSGSTATFRNVQYDGSGSDLKFTVKTYNSLGGLLYEKTFTQTVSQVIASDSDSDEPYLILDGFSYGAGSVKAGEEFTLNFSVRNIGGGDAYRTKITITDNTSDNDPIVTASRTLRYDNSTNYSVNIKVPVNIDVDTYKLSLTAEYQYYPDDAEEAVSGSANLSSIPISVERVERITLEEIETPAVLRMGEPVEIRFSAVNSGYTEARNAQVYITDNKGNEMDRVYLGTLSASTVTGDKPLKVTFDRSGSQTLTLTLEYQNAELETVKVTQRLKVKVSDSFAVSIEKINYSVPFVQNQTGDISFNLVSMSAEEFLNAQIFVLDADGNEIANSYLGAISPRAEKEELVISPKFSKTGEQTITLGVRYETADNTVHTVTQELDIQVSGSAGTASGDVKIQNISPQIGAEKGQEATITVDVVNGRLSGLSSVEVTLYDSNGAALYSNFVGKIEGQTSTSVTLKNVFTSNGVKNLKIGVKYKDSENNVEEVTRSFTMNIGENAGESANLKLQNFVVPNIVFTGVKTEIPFTIINAGLGKAYNVEAYIVDADGKEYARSFVGNLGNTESGQNSSEQKLEIKTTEDGVKDMTLVLYVEDENYVSSTIERNFSVESVPYRISIKDVEEPGYVEVGYDAQFEFSVLNAGTEELYNATAKLVDDQGNQYAELYIGTISPGTEVTKKRLKPVFQEAGTKQLQIVLSYENAEMNTFTLSYNCTAIDVQEPYVPEIVDPVPEIDPGMEEQNTGLPVWAWGLIIGGAVVIVVGIIITVVVVKKKKKQKDDGDDMDFFFSQNMMNPNLDLSSSSGSSGHTEDGRELEKIELKKK